LSDLLLGLARIQRDLDVMEVGWALVGGLAVSIRSEPRTTRDVDVAVAVSGDPEAEAVLKKLISTGYRVLESGRQMERRDTGRLAGMRLLAPGTARSVVDLLFHFAGIEAEIVAAAESLEVGPRLFVPVARTGHLIALKVLAHAQNPSRAQDGPDLVNLLRHADFGERQRARDAVDRIARSVFAPAEADLSGELGEWERRAGG
jgi:predicted nucleotidyltransferase